VQLIAHEDVRTLRQGIRAKEVVAKILPLPLQFACAQEEEEG
jgi:hypothetical protein